MVLAVKCRKTGSTKGKTVRTAAAAKEVVKVGRSEMLWRC